ncbi:MAG: LSM domain-containing protein [Candidatus Hydrothermarchaeota archaeon]
MYADDLLKLWLNKKVCVELKWGQRFIGKLKGFDNFMNLILENTSEISDEGETELGTIVIRGNNVSVISPVENVS